MWILSETINGKRVAMTTGTLSDVMDVLRGVVGTGRRLHIARQGKEEER